MPTMADITVKKHDGSTDQVWTKVQASGGDSSPATWRNTSVGSAPAFNPTFNESSKPNQAGTVRRVTGRITWPQTATGTDGTEKTVNTFSLSFDATLPLGMPSADSGEAAYQAANLIASALIKSSLETGYAPA